MRILTRCLALLAGALVLGGIMTEVAAAEPASPLYVTPSIKGAGSISGPPSSGPFPGPRTCEQAPPVGEADVLTCDRTWGFFTLSRTDVRVQLTAVAAPGWEFRRWKGCTSTTGSTCELVAETGGGEVWATPQAQFDDAPPEAILDLRLVPVGGVEGAYEAVWSASEPGLRFRCFIDGGRATDCAPNHRLDFGDGTHRITVGAVDSNRNAGPLKTVSTTVVDTELTVAPPEGAEVRTASFAALSPVGNQFECSIDGGAYAACGSTTAPSAGTSLTLPALGEGRHTLRVRARWGEFVDLFPATRTWIVDLTPPTTTLRPTATGFELGSNESGVTFRCRVDGGDLGRCDASYLLPPLAPGSHTFEAFAIDRAGNADPIRATSAWTIAAPVAAATATSAPKPATAAPVLPTAAPERLSFTLRYATRNGRLTRLAVTDLTPRADLRISVKCPEGKRCPKGFAKWNALGTVQLKRLVGKRLPAGTKITVRARRGQVTATQTITIKKGA